MEIIMLIILGLIVFGALTDNKKAETKNDDLKSLDKYGAIMCRKGEHSPHITCDKSYKKECRYCGKFMGYLS